MAHEYLKRRMRQFLFNASEFGLRYAFCKLRSERRLAERESIELIPQRKYGGMDETRYQKHLEKWYHYKTGKKLDLERPKTFSEKLQWLKLNDTTPLKTRLADKYEVRGWVADKIGADYLIPLLGVWDSFDAIDFDALPAKFVLKCTHGSACNRIVTDKASLDRAQAKRDFDFWMKLNYAFLDGFELQYKDIKPRIVAEAFVETDDGELRDYKIHCFNGTPRFVQVISDRGTAISDVFYDLDWQPMACRSVTMQHNAAGVPRPERLTDLIRLAAVLSEGFPNVRVDFYAPDHRLFFGEMTFTPSSGIKIWAPDSYNETFGEMIKL